jgi:predicted histidine transporter YuiF (NhaC family)
MEEMDNQFIWVTLSKKLGLDLWLLTSYQKERKNQNQKTKEKGKNKNLIFPKKKTLIASLIQLKWELGFFQSKFYLM